MVASNTIVRKAEQVMPGPVTDAIIRATEEETLKAVTRRAEEAFESLQESC
ncbi:MAG: hypothetical protein GTN80_00640 [Nitrososphaeria archaeon]|nr:hypothetical protein [Nitrososphaeria archaeon]NIQ32153.1 hypothetical protein [Nitrososphaeria archaeon]